MIPKLSCWIALQSGRRVVPLRRVRSQMIEMSPAARIALTPDHFVAIAQPNATPVASRHGRKIGDDGPLAAVERRLQPELGDHVRIGPVHSRFVVGVIHLDRFHIVRPAEVDGEPFAGAILLRHPERPRILIGHATGGKAVER